MKSPESRQFRQEHPHLSARNVLAATALAGAIAGFSPETAQANGEHQRGPVETGIRAYDTVQVGVEMLILDGAVTDLHLRKGVLLNRMDTDGEKVIGIKLKERIQVTHAYAPQADLAVFRYEDRTYSLRLNKQTSPFIKKTSPNTSKLTPFSPSDVSTSTAKVFFKDSGYLYRKGTKNDPRSGFVTHKGKNMYVRQFAIGGSG